MNIPRLFIITAVSVLLFSCEEYIVPEDNGIEFNIDQTSLSFPYNGGESTLNITASSEWSIVSSVDWCTVSPASGKSSATVNVTVSKNNDKLNGRSTRLIVKNGTIDVTVTVSQEVNQEEPDVFISSRSFDIPASGGEFEFTVVSDTFDFEITVVDSWIHELYHQGDRSTGETIRFKADGHETAARMGVISVCTKDGSCIPVIVNQAGWNQYVHMNMGYRFTATWCGYCPYMDEVFHTVADDPQNRFQYITFHSSSNYPLYFDDSPTFMDLYGIGGFPTGVINGWKELPNSTNVASNATKAAGLLTKFEESFACPTGISVSSYTVEDGLVYVSAEVKSIPGKHLIAAFLLESGIVQAQAYYPASGGSQTLSDYVHDNVARKALTASPEGELFTTSEEAANFAWYAELDSSWKTGNLSVAVLVMRPYNDLTGAKSKKSYPDYYIVNSVIAPLGTTKVMEYAK